MHIYIYKKRWFKYERHTSIFLNILFKTIPQTKYSDLQADNSPCKTNC